MTMCIDDDEILEAVDQEALERAIEIVRTKGTPREQRHIEAKLATDEWIDVAEFAAYSCQFTALSLRPWQSPPCWIDDVVGTLNAGDDGICGEYQAARLLRRLLDAGLSRYEPNPLAALAAKKAR
jgi:hypothetical protein